MDFEESERIDGVRLSWNVWPTSRLEAVKLVIPLGVMYTPLIRPDEVCVCDYPPVVCKNEKCQAILSPWCEVDYSQKLWICALCLTRNPFPPSYSHISQESIPNELASESTTIEYEQIQNDKIDSPAFLFVIDTAILDEELNQIKASIQQALTLLPKDSMVGLITFGKHVHLHEIGYDTCPKSIIFRGDIGDDAKNAISIDKIKSLLDINPSNESSTLKYLQPVSTIQDKFNNILNDLNKDLWPQDNGCRLYKCTGMAILVAVSLFELSLQGYNGRIMIFSGGAANVGPGKVVLPELGMHLRSNRDIIKGKASLYEAACKFYNNLAKHAVENGHIIDLFSCCLDQTGVSEQRILVDNTGGTLILSDTFCTDVFIESFRSLFMVNNSSFLSMCFNGDIKIRTSRQIKISGCVGPVSSMNEKTNCISNNEIGLGNTSKWSCGGLFPNTTFCFFFDVSAASNSTSSFSLTSSSSSAPSEFDEYGYIQFITNYRRSNGNNVTRVTTIGVQFANPIDSNGLNMIISGFDQEAAAVILARLSVYKADTEYQPDLVRWLDQQLIRLVSKIANYKKDDISSFALPEEFLYFPQFIFYLRRSQFMHIFDYSPDETAYFRCVFLKESVNNSLTMIQPTVHAYNLDGNCETVLLELSSRHPDKILLLDTFFHIVIWYGRNIAGWRDDHIENTPEYSWFKDLLNLPKSEANNRALERFPYPNIIYCDEASGQERFLNAKLNPDNTSSEQLDESQQSHGDFITDDVSLRVFMDHLKRLAVTSQT